MKKLLIIIFLILKISGFSQKINFGFDAAGNQISRVTTLSRISGVNYKTLENLKQTDYLIEDKIAVYPNPVLQELYVNWKNDNENIINNIELYSINGQFLNKYPDLKTVEKATVNFELYSNGIYILILNYENGKSKTLNIVKK